LSVVFITNRLLIVKKMDAKDNKILQIGNMSITEKAANEASDGLETEYQGTLLRCIDNQTIRR
jgi:hypothetical protein